MRCILRGCAESVSETMQGRSFGREGISYRRWVEMKGLIREYIREHEQEDRRLDQLNLLD